MQFDTYQQLARRTQNPDLNLAQRLYHALLGLSSEVGEIQAIYQKVYQGHSAEPEMVVDELGDVLWFCAELCDVLGVRMSDVASHNIAKLQARYPEGFDAERSVHREA